MSIVDSMSERYQEIIAEKDAEIERLRALPRLKKIMEREAEIERLRTQLADAKDQLVAMHRHVAEYLAEIERLRTILETAVRAQTVWKKFMGWLGHVLGAY